MNGKEIIRILKSLGWELKTVSGSHHQMRHGDGRKVSIPVHGAHDLKIKTVISIEKQAGVKLR